MRRLTTLASAAALSAGALFAMAPSASAAPVPYTCTPAGMNTTLDLSTSVTGGVLGALSATASVGLPAGAPTDVTVMAQGTVTTELVRDGAVVGTRVATLPSTQAVHGGTVATATWSATFGDTSTPSEAGTYTLRHKAVNVVLSAGDLSVPVTCTAGSADAIASWTVSASGQTTPAPAQRPKIVRTDAPQPQPSTLPVLVFGAGLVGAACIVGGARMTARSTRRD